MSESPLRVDSDELPDEIARPCDPLALRRHERRGRCSRPVQRACSDDLDRGAACTQACKPTRAETRELRASREHGRHDLRRVGQHGDPRVDALLQEEPSMLGVERLCCGLYGQHGDVDDGRNSTFCSAVAEAMPAPVSAPMARTRTRPTSVGRRHPVCRSLRSRCIVRSSLGATPTSRSSPGRPRRAPVRGARTAPRHARTPRARPAPTRPRAA